MNCAREALPPGLNSVSAGQSKSQRLSLTRICPLPFLFWWGGGGGQIIVIENAKVVHS